jgi:8-oxo-dGTP pyrophosphatase MutT (NUDIX family)
VPIRLLRERLRAATHPLTAPPCGDAWNSAELADMLPATLRAAAVLVPIVLRASGPTVVLTRRTEDLTHHAGQISFPGGRVEPGDRDLVDAALRETREEIGLDEALIEPVGYLDPYATITGFCVTPVVGLVQGDAAFAIDPREVAEAFEVPFAFLIDTGRHELRSREFRGRVRNYHAIQYGPHEIWGATAAMIVNLVERLRKATEAAA